jgi:hypothetical protein
MNFLCRYAVLPCVLPGLGLSLYLSLTASSVLHISVTYPFYSSFKHNTIRCHNQQDQSICIFVLTHVYFMYTIMNRRGSAFPSYRVTVIIASVT